MINVNNEYSRILETFEASIADLRGTHSGHMNDYRKYKVCREREKQKMIRNRKLVMMTIVSDRTSRKGNVKKGYYPLILDKRISEKVKYEMQQFG